MPESARKKVFKRITATQVGVQVLRAIFAGGAIRASTLTGEASKKAVAELREEIRGKIAMYICWKCKIRSSRS